MTDPNRPPLWEVMQEAGSNAPGTPRDAVAAEIRALRDWLVPEEEPPHPAMPNLTYLETLCADRQRLRALLTAEADRAERGND